MPSLSLGAIAQSFLKKLDIFFIRLLFLNNPFFKEVIKQSSFRWLELKISKIDKNPQSLALIKQIIYLIDRDYIRSQGTREDRQYYYEIARFIKRDSWKLREILAQEYIKKNIDKVIDRTVKIDDEIGIAIASLKGYSLLETALIEAKEIIQKKENQKLISKGSLDFIASSKKDFDSNCAIARLALDPNLLVPIANYFGILPILFGFDINRASSREVLDWSSHRYHLDPEDTMQIKVFIYLDDVDENVGPFTAISADKSKAIAEYFNYTVGRLKDEQVHSIIDPKNETICIGRKGTTIFCDTNRCFHYGGRIKERERYVLTIYYSLPTSTWFPLFPGDGERRNLTPLMRPSEDSEFEKALLGYELV
ncbi:MAG: hypothetical protein MUD14_10045 [Hydrococcus sp. Prado102]|jgi:hypothetical protein|nr:hypothetical protein [Hydrococcus sp. Prado102]